LPVLLIFKNGRKLLSVLPAVVFGKQTWVSYSGSNNKQLPQLKPGIIEPGSAYPKSEMADDINLAYARDYDVYRDLRAVFNYLFLGMRN
jgi:hypothetical protein